MRVSVYSRFTLKDTPEGYLGLRSEDWNIGKNVDTSFAHGAGALLYHLLDFYILTGFGADYLNSELEKLKARIAAWAVMEGEATDA